MAEFYKSAYTGKEIDSAIGEVLAADLSEVAENATTAIELLGSRLPLTGGTMTGQIVTSFGAVAMGSYCSTATTVDGLIQDVRYSSGCMGSVSISTAFTYGSVTIPAAWYNYVFIPHRTGGMNGAANNDNCNYGTLLLYGMTGAYGNYRIRFNGGSVGEVRKILEQGDLSTDEWVFTYEDGTTETKVVYVV